MAKAGYRGLTDCDEDFGFNPKYNGKSLQDFERKNNMIRLIFLKDHCGDWRKTNSGGKGVRRLDKQHLHQMRDGGILDKDGR